MTMKEIAKWIARGLLCVSITASAQVAVYDAATGVLTLPAVQVGSDIYTSVTLQNLGNYRFQLLGATQQVPPGLARISYDGATGLVNIPAVNVGSTTYVNVALRNEGGWQFALQTAAEIPAATLSGVVNLLGAIDALWANAVPNSGAQRYTYADSCYLNDGGTKGYLVSDWDANLQSQLAQYAFRVGEKRVNIQVLALRDLTNADSSTRQEVDVQFDTQYKDGSAAFGDRLTLITGSSAGSPGCANPTSSASWRNYGNRQLVQTDVRARNQRDEGYSIATGAPLSPLVTYRNDIQFVVTDPLGNATYVIVSGPGPTTTVNGVTVPFSLKLISPRLLRSAPELVGKNNNYLNWLDDDFFGRCLSTASGVPVASIADCAGQGAGGNNWGRSTTTPNANNDAVFLGQGWVAGAAYRFDVYNDDGWKTINGQTGKTPIATYIEVLRKLPYTFVEMAGGGTGSDKYSRISFAPLTPAQMQAKVVSASPGTVNLAWNALPALSDSAIFRVRNGWQLFVGPSSQNASGVAFPGYRLQPYVYPGSLSTSISNFQIAPALSQMSAKTFDSIAIQYVDRNGRHIFSQVSYN
jgi:hypothetical protein